MKVRNGICVTYLLAFTTLVAAGPRNSWAKGEGQARIRTIRLQSGEQPAGTLQAAIDGAGADVTIVLPGGYKETPTSPIAIKAANLTLACEPEVTIIKGGNFPLLSIGGSGDTIDGCTLDGNNAAGFTGSTLNLTGSKDAIVQNSTICNAEGQNISGYNFSGAHLLNNHVYGGWNSAISFNGDASNIEIRGGLLDSTTGRNRSSSKCVELHSQHSGTSVTDVLMTDFTCHNGLQWAIEWGKFGKDALPTQHIQIENVRAIAQTDTDGCFSAGSPSFNDLVENNTCDANGFGFTVAAYEIVEEQHSVYKNNSWVENGGRIQVGISLNSGSYNTLAGFNGRGWTNWREHASSGAMYINDQWETAGARTTGNEIGSNIFIQDPGDCVSQGCNGILLKSYRDGQEISHNRIHDNVIHLLGSSGSGPYGIFEGITTGIVDSNEFSNNQIEGAYIGVRHDRETNSRFAGIQCKHCAKAADGVAGSGTKIE